MQHTPPPLSVGIIGCGNISNAYFKGAQLFRAIEVQACADLNPEAARRQAETYGVEARSVTSLLESEDVEVILNLTIPAAHAEVNLQALAAGKHVYTEKPFALSLAESQQVLELAAEKGLRVGSAPDTFLGAGLQTCRRLVDQAWIGTPLSGTAFMLCPGHESWHPSPAFYYARGGGPMLDMGPYYLTALVHLLGPIRSVMATTAKARELRLATSEGAFGQQLPVEVPTHYSGTVTFVSGAVVTVVMSFDVQRHLHKNIELYGSAGSLQVPDPNSFGGPVRLFRPGNADWQDIPFTHGYRENSRSLGLADLATAIQHGRPHRCSGELAHHVLEAMLAFETSAEQGRRMDLSSTCTQPAPLPMELLPGLLDG